jgi:hypothetical protein
MVGNSRISKISPATLETHLKKIDCPANDNGFVKHGEENQASKKVFDELLQLREQEYVDVSKVIAGAQLI